MEATASGTLFRRVPFASRRAVGNGGMLTSARNRLAMVRMENKFEDKGHLRYYVAAAAPARCGPKKEEKRRMKLVKGLEKDLSALHSMGFDAAKGQDQDQQISVSY